MAWTDPKTFVAGTKLTAAELNTHLRDNLIDLRQVYARHDYLVNNQSISDSTATTVVWSGSVFEEGLAMSRASGVYTVNKAGFWKVVAQVGFEANATGMRQVNIFKGASIIAVVRYPDVPNTIPYLQVTSPPVSMTDSDTFTIQVFQSSGGSLNLLGGQDDTWVSLEWLGDT